MSCPLQELERDRQCEVKRGAALPSREAGQRSRGGGRHLRRQRVLRRTWRTRVGPPRLAATGGRPFRTGLRVNIETGVIGHNGPRLPLAANRQLVIFKMSILWFTASFRFHIYQVIINIIYRQLSLTSKWTLKTLILVQK